MSLFWLIGFIKVCMMYIPLYYKHHCHIDISVFELYTTKFEKKFQKLKSGNKIYLGSSFMSFILYPAGSS